MKTEYEPRPDHLYVKVSGAFEVHEARHALGDVLRECQARGLARILIDARGLTTPVSVADRYDLATRLADYGTGRLRTAIVVSPDNLFTKTLEDTATNRGAALRTTDSLEEAVAFLDLEAP